jgi:FkbM family methyltransferase
MKARGFFASLIRIPWFLKSAIGMVRLLSNWHDFFFDHIHPASQKELVYAFRNGLRMKVRSGTFDSRIINEIWVHQDYTPDGFGIAEDAIVVDVGAHIGTFSLFASRKARKGGVYAFEPMAGNFRMLEENIALNRPSNIICINKAMGGGSSLRQLRISADNSGGHSLLPSERSGSLQQVDCISLQDFIREYGLRRIDLLKLDCEGSEFDILFNAPDDAFHKIKRISMEYHDGLIDGSDHDSLRRFLEGKGYSISVREKPPMLYARKK